jgi:hypothetical protein
MNHDKNREVATRIATVAASALHQITTHLQAEASAIVLLQGDNIAATVIVPPGLGPDELALWAGRLARELRALSDEIEHGDTRAELERQAKARRAQQA